MSNQTAPTVRRGSSRPISLPTLAKRAPSLRKSMFGASRTPTKQVEVAVVVDVDKRRLSALPGASRPTAVGDVGKWLAGAVVAIELARSHRLAREADEEIDVAVGVEVTPRRRAGVGDVRDAELGGDVDEGAVIIPIQPIRLALSEPDEQIEVAVAVEVRPAVRLTARRGKHIGLHEFESRLSRRLRRRSACRLPAGSPASMLPRQMTALPAIRGPTTQAMRFMLISIPAARGPSDENQDQNSTRNPNCCRRFGSARPGCPNVEDSSDPGRPESCRR